jgi:putative FmdB family regulatory protein
MPTYDYACGQCGHELEIFHSMTDAPKRKCPACGKNKLQRRIGAGAAILFKGSGFYQTDYRSASYAASAKGDSETAPVAAPEKGGESKDAPTAEAKPEPTPPPKPQGGGSKPDKGSKKKAG